MQCLIGDLITKPRELQEVKKTIDEKEENEEALPTRKQPNNVTEQYEEKPIHIDNTLNERNSKITKLSSLELRSTSFKIYKSQKIRIRQVSNSPFQQDLKTKESLKTLSKVSPSYLQHNLGIQTSRQAIEASRNNIEKGQTILRKIKQRKEFERSEPKKAKDLDFFNTINAYTRKVRDQQRTKYII